ncbi:hypothetical protein [Salinicola aestuarinus]|uniref:hypothetical protein n=1 Tax=Salinicola aestuarinus TaxID=1949082 RepID=UPI0013006EA6|nr:hypothetical protein [Salinicola aestuarinus]
MSSIWKSVALGIGALGASAVSAVVAAKAADKVSDSRENERRTKLDEEFDQLRRKTNPATTPIYELEPSDDSFFTKVGKDSLNETVKRRQKEMLNDYHRVLGIDSNSYDDEFQREVFEEGKQKDGQA